MKSTTRRTRARRAANTTDNEEVRNPVWLWPNLLSLDAPVVAVAWQLLFLRCLRAEVRWTYCALLFLAVWTIYLADRLLDTARGQIETPRHRFLLGNRRFAAFGMMASAAAIAGLLATPISRTLALHGLEAATLSAVYLVLAPLLPGGLKEAAVAAIFALGTSLAAWDGIHTVQDVATVGMFSLLCWLNCMAIEKWEGTGRRLPVDTIALTAAALGWVALRHERPILSGAAAASMLGLALLDRLHRRFSPNACRVLADAVLLTPLALLPTTRWS